MTNTEPLQQFHIATKIILKVEDEVLILFDTEKQWWELPGGRISKGEKHEDALKRELLEECGIELKGDEELTKVDWFPFDQYKLAPEFQYMAIVTEVVLNTKPQIRLSDEHQDFRWVDLNTIHDYKIAIPDIKQALLKSLTNDK